MATNLSNRIWWEKPAKNPADLHIFLTEITTQTVNYRLKDLGLYIFVRDFRRAYTRRDLWESGLITGIEKKKTLRDKLYQCCCCCCFIGGGGGGGGGHLLAFYQD